MKKSLIALALAALPVASMADVVLYGNIKGGFEVSKQRGQRGTDARLVDYGSSIGFKGQEQLNGNLKAIWQLEQRVNVGGGATSFGTKDSFLGLTGDFGTIKAGYQQTPVQELNGKLDIWNYGNQAAGLGKFTRATNAARRYAAVTYETPNFNGFSAKVFVSPEDNNALREEVNNGLDISKSAVYGLGLSFGQETGLFADLAAAHVRTNGSFIAKAPANSSDYQVKGYQALAQVGYKDPRFMAGVAYQTARNVEVYASRPNRSNEIALTGAYNVDDALRLKLSAATGWGKTTKVDRYWQGIVGADYALSKRTVANAQFGYKQDRAAAKSPRQRVGALSIGVSHKF